METASRYVRFTDAKLRAKDDDARLDGAEIVDAVARAYQRQLEPS